LREETPIFLFQLLLVGVLVHIAFTWVRAIQRSLAARRCPQETQGGDLPLPPASILIPAWNERGTIEPCIRSLQLIDYPAWEVVILAGGADGTVEAVVQASAGDGRFRVLQRGPEPKNVALSLGIEVARYDVLVILDADSVVAPAWLRDLVKPVAGGSAASFGMHHPSKETWISMAEQMQFVQAYEILGSKLGAGCSSLAIRREVLERIGPLPPAAYSWEDWDIDIRLLDAGEQVSFAPGARLLTHRPFTFSQYWAATLRSYRSHLAGVWYHRDLFLRRPLWGVYELFFLVYGAMVSLAALGAVILVAVVPSLLPTVSLGIALFALWTLGRRAALGVEVAVFTGERKWLAWFWAPVVLLPVQFLAALVAILTLWRQPSFDYKGVRFADSSTASISDDATGVR
jgi:cellulose synthase/poly-beta-1,6-N-acetylglucosamine synthase-like glycosyltransferase